MKRLRKVFAMTLAVMLVLSCVPVSAAAEPEDGQEDEQAEVEVVDTSEVAGTYTSGDLTLELDNEGHFTMSGTELEESVSGTFTYEIKGGWGGPSTNVTLDGDSMAALSDVMPWYSYLKLNITVTDEESGAHEGTFAITKDVSMALVNNDDIGGTTVENPESKTGFTTTFTVKDDGYESVYAYGDWVADYMKLTDEEDPTSYSSEIHNPDTWENGMNYYTSSVLPLEQGEDGSWTLTLDLASSVMGIACYHDVAEGDLKGLFPQKKSFYIPYDAEKQSDSFDWSPAFPASENGNAAGTIEAVTTPGGVALNVYTPAGYDENETYPVMYLIAGGGSTEASWFTQGMAGNVFDNLTAEGAVVPTVLVAMGFQSVSGTQLQEDVIPYIEDNYSVYTDAAHRALGGVSMGSATATNIWLANPELFSYYAFLSGANKSVFTDAEVTDRLDDETVAKLQAATYFIGGGTTDFNMFEGDANSASITQLDAWMDYYGIDHNVKGTGEYDIVMGDHNWPIWMQLLIPFASEYLWKDVDASGDEPADPVEPETEVPTLTVTSDILGLADTGNKSTLKVDLINTGGPGDTALYYYNEEGKRVQYEDQDATYALEPVHYTGSAVLDLGDDVDDSKINSSNAVVKLIDGSGYYAEELILSESAQHLSGAWENGKLTYELTTGDLEWNNWDYYDTDYKRDYNSGREWSMMGGDGNGVYFFTLEVSGITYDGKAVAAARIPFAVYIYGRSSADLGLSTKFVQNTYDESYTSGLAQSDEIQWNWYTANPDSEKAGEPYLNDPYTDYISVVWPTGTDASGITAEDVTVTLRSVYGEELVLSENNGYGEQEYAVISHEGETEVFVTYQQWAYVPVYSTMEITIDNGELQATHTYDISSVTTYLVQTGGGGLTVDHTVTVYNHYGIENMTLENSVNTGYTLSAEIDGTTYYYAEDENGVAYLSEAVQVPNVWGFGTSAGAPDDAMTFDGTEKYHLAVYNNVVYVETRLDNTEVKTVNGEEITFTQNISATKSDADMIAAGATLVPGYNLNGSSADKWSWSFRYQSGWTTESDEPTALPYPALYPYGFTADTPEEERPYYGMEASSGIGGGPGGPGGPGGDFGGGPGGDIGGKPDGPGSSDETDTSNTPSTPGEAENPGTPGETGTPSTPSAPDNTNTSGSSGSNSSSSSNNSGSSSSSSSSGSSSSSSSSSSGTAAGDTPATGDSGIPVYLVVLLIAGIVLAGYTVKKRFFDVKEQ